MPAITQHANFASAGIDLTRTALVAGELRGMVWGGAVLAWGALFLAWGSAPGLAASIDLTSNGLSFTRSTTFS